MLSNGARDFSGHPLIEAVETLVECYRDGELFARIYSPAKLEEAREEVRQKYYQAYNALGLEAPPLDFSKQ